VLKIKRRGALRRGGEGKIGGGEKENIRNVGTTQKAKSTGKGKWIESALVSSKNKLRKKTGGKVEKTGRLAERKKEIRKGYQILRKTGGARGALQRSIREKTLRLLRRRGTGPRGKRAPEQEKEKAHEGEGVGRGKNKGFK